MDWMLGIVTSFQVQKNAGVIIGIMAALIRFNYIFLTSTPIRPSKVKAPVSPLNVKKVRICENMSGGFEDEIQR